MCQNLFIGRVVQNIANHHFVCLFSYHNLKIRLSVIRKARFLSVFDFFGLRDHHFQEIRYFLFVRTVGSSIYYCPKGGQL